MSNKHPPDLEQSLTPLLFRQTTTKHRNVYSFASVHFPKGTLMSDLSDSRSEYRSRRRRYGSPAPSSYAPSHQSSRRISGTQSPAAHQCMLLEVPIPRTTIAHLYVVPHRVRSQGAFSSLLTITRTTARQTRCGQALAGAPHPRAFR